MDGVSQLTRDCSRCGIAKPLTPEHFARDRGGYARNCRSCKGKRPSFEERFWGKVQRGGPGECWEWQAGRGNHGYGELQRGARGQGMATSHRVAYELSIGPIPDGLCVMHACDNRVCCNPAHLSLGTLADNNQDMKIKGRMVCRPPHGPRKLTSEAVSAMRARRASGEKPKALAARFGVTEAMVSAVVTRRSWKDVP